MDQATNMETQLAEQTLQDPALAQSGSNVLRRHIKENPKKAVLARHRLWQDSIPHEYPMTYTPYKIGVYILLAEKDTQFLKNLCCYLADRIQELGDILEEQSRQLLMDDLAIGRTAGEENGWIPAEDVRQHFTERI